MIPSDLAVRLRMMMEAAVLPLSAVRELPADLPSFSSGQRFTAHIHSELPDGTYRAIVTGRTVMLSLPQTAKVRDTLELVVIDRTPRSIIAAQGGLRSKVQAEPTAGTTLSRAAQLISGLLPDCGSAANCLPPLRASVPILSSSPNTGATLAPLLQSAISESGLFYESHQAQWVAGRLSARTLLREAQGQHSPVTQPLQAKLAPPGSDTVATVNQSAAAPGPRHPLAAVPASKDAGTPRGSDSGRNALTPGRSQGCA